MRSKKILSVSPFNDTFMNCIDNNHISILSTYHSSYKHLQYYYKGRYNICEMRSEISVSDELYHNGTFMLQFELVRPNIKQFFDHVELDLDKNIDPHLIIKGLIDDGYYVFLDIDRFYLRGGLEYNKQNRILPTFLHGYSNEGHYYSIEDCVKFGVFDHYMMQFEDFNLAYQSVAKLQKSKLFASRIKKDLEPFKTLIELKVFMISKLTTLLDLCTDDSKLQTSEKQFVTVRYGLSSIQTFSILFEAVFSQLADSHIDQFIPISHPYQTQRVNLHLVDICFEQGLLSSIEKSNLTDLYELLSKNWLLYKNILMKYLV